MSFQISNIDLGGSDRLRAAMAIGEDIRKARAKYEEDQRKQDFNQGLFNELQNETDSQGNSVIPPRVLESWASMNPDKQAGALSGILSKRQEEKKTKLAQMQIDAANRTSPFAGTKVYDDSGTDVGVYDERGTPHFYGGRSSKGAPEIAPVVDPNTRKVIPGKGLNTLTGQVIDLTDGHPMAGQIFYDPETAEPRGIYKQNGDVSFFPKKATVDPLKEAIARQITGTTPKPPPPPSNMDQITGQVPLPGVTRAGEVPAATPAPSATAPVINNEQDYAALPAGSTYIDARDGKLKRKKPAQ